MLQAQIFFDRDELHGTQLLENFIMNFLLHEKVSGATAFRASRGFGPNQHMNQPDRLFSFDEPPMLIIFIDEDEKVKKTLAKLRKEFTGGLIVTSPIEKW